jgi:hypothetical protein
VNRHRAVLAMGLMLVIVGAPRESPASTTLMTAQLDYAVAPGCPSAERFKAIVTGRLGYDPFQENARERVVVQIDSGGRALEGRIEWRNIDGRSIGEQAFPSRTGDCAELTRAMGFALALQIHLMATTIDRSDPPPAPDAAAQPPPVTAATPQSPTLPVPVPRRGAQVANGAPAAPETSAPARGPEVLVAAGISAGLGMSPSAVGLGRLSVAVAWSRVAVELAGEVSAPSTTSRPGGSGFSQEELLASLAGCVVISPMSACAVGKIGELRVVGHGVDVPLTSSGMELQTGLRLAASHSLGRRAAIIVRAEGLGRVNRGAIMLDSMPVWTTPRYVALFGMDIAFRFR